MTDRPGRFASPACDLQDWQETDDPSIAADIAAWRQRERERLLTARQAVDAATRAQWAAAIARKLLLVLGEITAGRQQVVAVYWPIRDEPDLRPHYHELVARGFTLALPLVTEKNQALEFRRWQPGEELDRDLLGIPAPLAAAELTPDIVVMPFVGVDQRGFRLGNGGGYYDRTLPGLPPATIRVTVGYAHAELRTIYPQTHDVPAQIVITEEAVRQFSAADHRRNDG